jgi:hypothetical protein
LLYHPEMKQDREGRVQKAEEVWAEVEWEEIVREQVRQGTACVPTAGQEYPTNRGSLVIR